MPHRPIRRALVSVSDKTGIIEFAKALVERNIELIATGGTARLLSDHQIAVTEVSDFTGFPEIMGGRVKTLHPRVHGGILSRPGIDDDIMDEHGINAIDLVIINLYPFSTTVAKQDCLLTDAIENIDIGGPAMIRSAAKNHSHTTVIVDCNDYQNIIQELDKNHLLTLPATRFHLAVKAFEYTAHYDGTIANYFGQFVPLYSANGEASKDFPRTLNLQFIKKQDMRYGENNHQRGAFYIERDQTEPSISTATQLAGKTLSYNNIADTDAALECVKEFAKPACVIVKHANPCGVAMRESLLDAYLHAHQCDPTSAYGGIIAFNQQLDANTAQAILVRQFVEVIIAPSITPQAQTILSTKNRIRLLAYGDWTNRIQTFDTKKVNGGLLVQDRDLGTIAPNQFNIVSKRKPTEQELTDAKFSWKVVKYVKSNAIVYVKNEMTLGIGAGQMSRIYSAKIASIKAQEENLDLKGSVMASDAFFPFRDAIDTAAAAGVTCIIQPGGSIRDDEVINAANEHNIAMIFTGMRHFRH